MVNKKAFVRHATLNKGRPTRSSRKSERVTLSDVAREAGVSVMTVSNVVNGRRDLLKLETLSHVESVIARMNYRPNVSARSLRLASAFSVGIIIVDTDPAFLTDPFISRLVSGLSNYLSGLDYTLDIQGVRPEKFAGAHILSKAGNDALCAILCGPKPLRSEHQAQLQRLGQPLVVFQETAQPVGAHAMLVRQNDLRGGELLAEHLRARDVQSVLFLRPTLDWSAVEQREQGLRAGFARARPAVEVKTLLAPSEDFDDVCETLRKHLQRDSPPGAIAAATDSMAVAALKVCESLGLKVPSDIRVTGFNGFDVWRHTSPILTTVMSPAYEMGRFAGEALITRLRTGRFESRRRVFSVSLRQGESS